MNPLLLALLLNASPAPQPQCFSSTGEVSSFEFASNPWLNLFNFLFEEAKHARGVSNDAFAARGYVGDDTAAARPLTASEAADWSAAVDFFARLVIPERLGADSLVQNVSSVLARIGPNDSLDSVPLPMELRRVMRAAMPIYRSAWWPTHDRRNVEWITSMRVLLAGDEICLVQRAESVLQSSWPSFPIHVDASVYANWFGAYSTHHPTRITVSANAQGSQGGLGLEVLLHETMHGMLDPLDSALAHEAADRHKRLPVELSHLVLFYTAGALMRERQPSYIPFAEEFGIWRQNPLARRYYDLIKDEWQPYLAGSRSFADAIGALVRRLP